MTDSRRYREIGVTPLSQALGAQIDRVDLAEPLSDSVMAELKDAFARYSVIFFRDQSLSPQQHIDLAGQWGEININRFFKPLDGYPQIAEVIKTPDQKENTREEEPSRQQSRHQMAHHRDPGACDAGGDCRVRVCSVCSLSQ